MSSTAAKVIAAVAIFLTVILAVLGYRVSRQYAENSEKAQQAVQKEDATPRILAVVALKPLGAYRKIEKDSVALAEVTVAPKDYYTSLEDVVGKAPLVDVDQGAPVTKRYFAEGNVLARSVPAGFQAVSVEISDVIGVGGFVRPGDIVDVLLYLREASGVTATQARVLLKNVRVLAYEELLVDRPGGLKDDEKSDRGQRRQQRTAVLAVLEPDTTRLMLGASLGELRLALHGIGAAENTVASATDLPPTTAVPASSSPVAAAASMPAALPAADAVPVSGGLPPSPDTLRTAEERKVPDKAVTAEQLSRIELPPALRRKVVTEKIYVYRSSKVETVVTP